MFFWYHWFVSNTFYQLPEVHFMPREQLLIILRHSIYPQELHFVVSRSDLHQIAQIFFLRVHRINSDFTVESESFILLGDRPNRIYGPKSSKSVRTGQYCTKSLGLFVNVFISLILNFLSIQNILFHQGTAPI